MRIASAASGPIAKCGFIRRNPREKEMVSRDGIEPSTRTLKVCCSAN